MNCPHPVGSEMWVRESYFQRGHWSAVLGAKARTRKGRQRWAFVPESEEVTFEVPPGGFRASRNRKDSFASAWHRRLGRFMPRRYSRITLKVTDVRVQRLQDISRDDAASEGLLWVMPTYGIPGAAGSWDSDPRISYRWLWESINGPGSWAANPFVWKYTFERTA